MFLHEALEIEVAKIMDQQDKKSSSVDYKIGDLVFKQKKNRKK